MAPHSNIYIPLEPERSLIRLVTIHPKDQVSQQIKCDLETYLLDEQPGYEALSYVWGDEGHDKEILLNGQVFPVRRNLAFALKDLRLADQPRRLWIDAICINQGDHEERSSQVLLMRHIYKYASRVVVSPGINTSENVSALNLLRSVNEMIKTDEDETPSQSDLAKLRNYLDTDILAKEGLSHLFHNLLRQAWWGRVWVIQEVAVSSRATVVIGESELKWSSLCYAITIIILTGVLPTELDSPMLTNELSNINQLSNVELLRRRVKQGSLLSISTLVAGNRQAATDPRDLVYAFVGLAKECDDPLLTPNYLDSNTASATFINFIEYSVRIEKTLDVISLSQGEIRNDFPSWCPDWTKPPPLCWQLIADVSGRAPFPLIPKYLNFWADNPWHACGNKSPVAKFIRSPLTLKCKGLIVDVVEVIGDPIGMGVLFNYGQSILMGLTSNLFQWEGLVLDHFEGLKSKMTQPADGPSIFDVSDQFYRHIVSLKTGRDRAPRTLVSLLKVPVSKHTYSSRRLQKLRRKTRLLFQGFHFQYIMGGPLAEAYVRTLTTNRLNKGNVMTDSDYELFWSKVPESVDDPAPPSPAQSHRLYAMSMLQNTAARTLVLTKKGYLGLGPTKARKGDLVCILYGCSVPVIIREYGQGHRFVGESYIHGLMYGAAVDQQSLRDTMEEQEFILR